MNSSIQGDAELIARLERRLMAFEGHGPKTEVVMHLDDLRAIAARLSTSPIAEPSEVIAHCPRCDSFTATYVGETCRPCMEQIYKSNPALRLEHAARLAASPIAEPSEAQSSIEELTYIAGHETTPIVVAQAALRAKSVIERLAATTPQEGPSEAMGLLREVVGELEGLGIANAELDELDISADLYARIKAALAATTTPQALPPNEKPSDPYLGRIKAERQEGPSEGSITLDNASVQRLFDYGLLEYVDGGWIVAYAMRSAAPQGEKNRGD